MKKLLLSSLIILLIVLLSACKKENLEIPLFIYDYQDNYMMQFMSDILDTDYGDYTIVPYDSANSQMLQNEQISSALEKQPKVIIVNPVDRLSVYTIIEKANEAGVAIIFINREPLREDMEGYDNIYYIGAPAENSAIIQSQIVMDLFGPPDNLNDMDKNGDGRIDLVILKGEQGHQDAEIRSLVFLSEMTDNGYDVNILNIAVCDFLENIARTNMLVMLDNFGNQIEIVVSNNDAMAIGAIASMVNEGYIVDENSDGFIDHETEPWIPVVGIDGIDEAIDLIDKGYLYSSVLNDTYAMADAIHELAIAIIENRDVTTIGYDIVDDRYIWIDYREVQ